MDGVCCVLTRLLLPAGARKAAHVPGPQLQSPLCFSLLSLAPIITRRRTVESELGMGLEDVFASVDRQPLATASIAQVGPAFWGGSRSVPNSWAR